MNTFWKKISGFLIFSVLLFIHVEINSSEQQGKVAFESFYSNQLKKEWDYMVYYPPAYEKSNKKFPVIYILHGMTHSPKSWEKSAKISKRLNKLINNKSLPPSIVIFPNGYSSWYVDSPSCNMYSAFTKDLFPYIENKFPLINHRESRAIGGLSMGGHGALLFTLGNPAYFATSFLLSPSVTKLGKNPPNILHTFMKIKKTTHIYGSPISQEKWDEYSYHHFLPSYLKQTNKVRFYLTTGDIDVVTPLRDTRDLVEDLKTNNIDYTYKKIRSRDHSWLFWRKATERALIYVGKYLKEEK